MRSYSIYTYLLFLGLSANLSGQRFTFGEFSGINFSNVHGIITANKWESKPGPVAGLTAQYRFSRSLYIQSELNYLTYYYEVKNYEKKIYDLGPSPMSYYIAPTYYPPKQQNWNFTFLRLPLLFKYQTNTRLQLSLGVGTYYSFVLNKQQKTSSNGQKYETDFNPPDHDWGYIFNAELSYPINKQLSSFIATRISTGRKTFIDEYKAKNGASEFLIGLKFAPPKKNSKVYPEMPPDSLSRIYLKPVSGVIYSWNSTTGKGNYKPKTGFMTGVIVGHNLGKVTAIQTGVLFMREGYAFTDSSIYNFRYGTGTNSSLNAVDTKVRLDYLTIPLNLNLSFGRKFIYYADLGTYAGFLLNATCRGTAIRKYSNNNMYLIEKVNLNDVVEGYFKSVDWGYLAGAGIRIPIRGNLLFDLGIRYSGSFNNQYIKQDNEITSRTENLSIKNRSITLQAGIKIPVPY